MNYLAHFHIADHCNSNLAGNLLGDFVKGDPTTQFPEIVSQGIMLHRAVDSFTDSHELVSKAKSYFPEENKRFAGIALDMFWDHCLAEKWNEHSDIPLQAFVAETEIKIDKTNAQFETLPAGYLTLCEKMFSQEWLVSYRHFPIMEKALINISKRRRGFEPLVDCYQTFEQHYDELFAIFDEFYPLLLAFSKEQ